MQRVRFLNTETNEIAYPEPLDVTGDRIIPSSGASTPPAGSLALNPLLTPASLHWDVRHSLKTHVKDNGWRQREVNRLAEPATFPPVARLEIRSPQLPWRVVVFPRTPNVFITVYDVLVTIYKTLKTRIAPGEWERFDDGRKYSILDSKNRRAQEYEFGRKLDECYDHPRRVDFLGECSQFVGLVPTPYRSSNSFDLEFVRRG